MQGILSMANWGRDGGVGTSQGASAMICEAEEETLSIHWLPNSKNYPG